MKISHGLHVFVCSTKENYIKKSWYISRRRFATRFGASGAPTSQFCAFTVILLILEDQKVGFRWLIIAECSLGCFVKVSHMVQEFREDIQTLIAWWYHERFFRKRLKRGKVNRCNSWGKIDFASKFFSTPTPPPQYKPHTSHQGYVSQGNIYC